MIQTEQRNISLIDPAACHCFESTSRSSIWKILLKFFIVPVLRARARRLSPHIFDAIHNCSTILDFGCGDMILTEFLKQKSPQRKFVGIDTLDSNLSSLPVLLYDGTRLPFETKSFDAIIVGFVLHHCQNISAVLEEIKRVAIKKIIILEEVYKCSFSKKLLHCHDFGNRLISWKMNIPLNFLTHEDWIDTFKKLDLSIKSTYRIYQYPLFNLTHQVFFEIVLQ